jgi:hypothetical protein
VQYDAHLRLLRYWSAGPGLAVVGLGHGGRRCVS